MNKELNEALMLRFTYYRNNREENCYSMLDCRRKAKKDHLEFLQEQINVTWSPFKRLRLLQEMVELMNSDW